MKTAFQGISAKSLTHLRRAVSAHRAMLEGVATHAEKERVRREKYATQRHATEAVLGPFKGTSQPV